MKKIIVFGLLAVFSTSLGMESNQLNIRCGTCVDVGTRRNYQEDLVHLCLGTKEENKSVIFASDLNKLKENNIIGAKGTYFFGAVYDGHRGNATALFAQNNLYKNFVDNLKNKHTIQDSWFNAFKKTEEDIKNAIKCSGATAIVSYIFGNILYILNLGDSHITLAKSNGEIFATKDLDLKNSEERERIIKAGGHIETDPGQNNKEYVDLNKGGLDVTASFGDHNYDLDKKIIRTVPDYYKISPIKDSYNFMIIASDGFSGFVSDEIAVATVYEKLQDGWSLEKIAEELKNNAIKAGSEDNISVVIVTLSENIVTPTKQYKSKFLIPIINSVESNLNIISFITNRWFIGTFSVVAFLGAIYCYLKFIH